MVSLKDARAPEGMRLYAIGDVHGCLEPLRGVHDAIAQDLKRRPVDDWRIIHVGDYVDRGPDNRGVVEYLIARMAEEPRIICLLGNHDQMFLAGIEGDSDMAGVWLANGGEETLADYGVGIGVYSQRFRAGEPPLPEVPKAHVDFLRSLGLYEQFGDYAFVHAGIKPDVPLEQQSERTLLWIRDEFLESSIEYEHVIIHGHTPRPKIDIRTNRIGIDTAAVFGNRLTCLVLEGAQKNQLIGSWLEPLPS